MNELLPIIRRQRRPLVTTLAERCGPKAEEPDRTNVTETARGDGGSATGNRPTGEIEQEGTEGLSKKKIKSKNGGERDA